jgi:hypothetical protein
LFIGDLQNQVWITGRSKAKPPPEVNPARVFKQGMVADLTKNIGTIYKFATREAYDLAWTYPGLELLKRFPSVKTGIFGEALHKSLQSLW